MTRWLRGGFTPISRFKVKKLASLEAGAVEGEDMLESAKEECAHLIELAARSAVENLSPSCTDFKAVMTLLKRAGDIHLWHVAAHGRLGVNDPSESYVVLNGQRHWRVGDMTGPDVMAIQSARPLVFFNACLVAEQAYAFDRLGGWPAAWIDQRCGGFVGPQWSVSSNLAKVFALAFYDAVVGDPAAGIEGLTLGEAARKARLAVREEAPLDPAWLSYAVYGHPNAVVAFG
jgi:hypothetical protein